MNRSLGLISSNYAQYIGSAAIFLVFTVISLIYFQWTWTDLIGDFGGDNALYLHTAKFLSPYSLHTDVATYFAKNNPYPPLVPLILALTGGAESIYAAHLVTTIFLLGSFALLYVWANQTINSKLIAMVIVAVFASSTMTYMHALEILSENYYLFFTLLVLVLTEYAKEKEIEYKVIIAASLFAGISILVRSAGISLMLAFAIYVWVNYPMVWRRRLYLIMLSPLLLSKLLNFKAENDLNYSTYLSDKFSTFHSISDVISHFISHIERFIYAWGHLFGVSSTVGLIVVYAIGVLSIMGIIIRAKTKHLDGLYALTYILLLLLWPFSPEAERYLYPIAAVMLVQGIYLVNKFTQHTKYIKHTQIFFLVAILTNNIPEVAWTYARFNEELPERLSSYRHTAIWYSNKRVADYGRVMAIQAMTEAMQAISQAVPEDQCVFSIKPSIVGMYSGRVSLPTPREKLNNQEFLHEVADKGCQYFFVLPFNSMSYSSAFYPAKRIEGTSVLVFYVENNAALYKLNN